MYDEELPGGFQDADFEMRELTEAANRESRLRKKGICTHGWRQTPPGKSGPCTCLHCGQVFATEALCDEARREALI